MSGVRQVTARGWLGQVLAFARAAVPRTMMSRRSAITDILLAAVVLAASLMAVGFRYPAIVAAAVTSVPLAVRRRFPLAVFLVVLVGTLATKDYATDITFLAVVIAACPAVVHGRFRGAALICVPLAGVAVAAAFWNAKFIASSRLRRAVRDSRRICRATGVPSPYPRDRVSIAGPMAPRGSPGPGLTGLDRDRRHRGARQGPDPRPGGRA